MALNVGELFVQLNGDNKNLNKALGESQKDVDKTAERINNFKKTATLAFAAIGTVAIGIGIKMAKMAIDAEETEGKFVTAFRGIENQAQQTALALGKSYNISQAESKRLLSGTGDLLKGFGFTATEALGLSLNVQKLAADLASYNNLQGGTTRASEILTKALLGERDALVSLGIKISDADVQQRLLETGQKDLTGQALLAAKAQVTYELALQQSADAQGDVARTAGSTANQIRQFQANVENLATNMGTAFLPTINAVTVALNQFFEVMELRKETKLLNNLTAAREKLAEMEKTLMDAIRASAESGASPDTHAELFLEQQKLIDKHKEKIQELEMAYQRVGGFVVKEIKIKPAEVKDIIDTSGTQQVSNEIGDTLMSTLELSTTEGIVSGAEKAAKEMETIFAQKNQSISRYANLTFAGTGTSEANRGTGRTGIQETESIITVTGSLKSLYEELDRTKNTQSDLTIEAMNFGYALKDSNGELLNFSFSTGNAAKTFVPAINTLVAGFEEAGGGVAGVVNALLSLLMTSEFGQELFQGLNNAIMGVLKVLEPFAPVVTFLADVIAAVANALIWIVNGVIKLINKIPGVNIKTVDKLQYSWEMEAEEALKPVADALESGIKKSLSALNFDDFKQGLYENSRDALKQAMMNSLLDSAMYKKIGELINAALEDEIVTADEIQGIIGQTTKLVDTLTPLFEQLGMVDTAFSSLFTTTEKLGEATATLTKDLDTLGSEVKTAVYRSQVSGGTVDFSGMGFAGSAFAGQTGKSTQIVNVNVGDVVDRDKLIIDIKNAVGEATTESQSRLYGTSGGAASV